MTAGIAELKAKLSEYLAKVRAGNEVVITDHGRPIARIVPVPDDEDARLAELERQGLIRRGTGKLPDDFFDRPLPKSTGPSVLDALLEERREGR